MPFVRKFRVPLKGLPLLAIVTFLYSFVGSLTISFFPNYLKTFFHNDAYVGYVISFTAIIMLLSNFAARPLFKYFKNKLALFQISILVHTLFYLALLFTLESTSLLVLLIIKTFFAVIGGLLLSLFIRGFATRNNLGQVEGSYFVVMNLAFLLGPLFGGLIANRYSYFAVFAISSFISLLVHLLVYHQHFRNISLPDHSSLFANVGSYFKRRSLRYLYFLSFGLISWWVFVYTFLPLYLKNLGVTEAQIGLLFFALVIPLILFEIPLGKLADRYGSKIFFVLGFFVLSICSFFLLFFHSLWIFFSFIILASLGAALLEPTREIFFFRVTKKKESSDFLPVYRTSVDLAYLIFPFLFSNILLFSSYKFAFLFTFLVLVSFFVVSLVLWRSKI